MKISSTLEGKLRGLENSLSTYERCGVAFSGGVDSTLLSFLAHKVLGSDKVAAYNITSELTPSRFNSNAAELHESIGLPLSSFKEIRTFPLYWKEFVRNNDERCYFCKKRMYSAIYEQMVEDNVKVLVDGTNTDDLKQTRPGLKAIRELNVKTPYVENKVSKEEVRMLARFFNLPNHDLPSNSCLATRIESNTMITKEKLEVVLEAELYLAELGFHGNRVKPRGNYTIVEVRKKDLKDFVDQSNTLLIQHKFNALNLGSMLLDVNGRD